MIFSGAHLFKNSTRGAIADLHTSDNRITVIEDLDKQQCDWFAERGFSTVISMFSESNVLSQSRAFPDLQGIIIELKH